jgi:hypothetical protein
MPCQLLGAALGLPPDQVAQFGAQFTRALQSGQFPGMRGGMPGAPGGVPPGAVRVQLSEAESADIARLVEMGFDRTEALQVYMACGKNVEAAASILFDGLGDGAFGGPGTGGPAPDGGTGGQGGGDDQMY